MRTTFLAIAFLLCGVCIGAGALWWWLSGHPQQLGVDAVGSISVEVEDVPFGEYVKLPLPKSVGLKPRLSKVIYLNREGAELFAGDDLAARNVSSLVRHSQREKVEIPGFSGSPNRWTAIVKCLRKAFAAYDVEVVERRPVTGSYVMAVFGGKATLLGKKSGHSHATGLAPFSGRPIADAVVLVFTSTLRNSLRNSCQTAAMEIAHAYGLDHGYHCRDFMTYKKYCGPRRFVDEDVRCGEGKPRDCKGGNKRQNSHKHLLTLLGDAKKR